MTSETFKNAFEALSWCVDNPMREILVSNKCIVRFNSEEDCFEYLNKDNEWEFDDSSTTNILGWKNIKVYEEIDEKKQRIAICNTNSQCENCGKIWEWEATIGFCPYCGCKLGESKKQEKQSCEDNCFEDCPHHYNCKLKQQHSIWSADGMLLNEDIPIEEIGEFYRYKGDFYKTKEQAYLERDKDDVEYIMKKFACESRSDNDWRARNNGENFYIMFDGLEFFIDTELYSHPKKPYVSFNRAYFNTEQDAKKCLDYLLEKYGIEKLKEIWGYK